jgi:hypothetical protein
VSSLPPPDPAAGEQAAQAAEAARRDVESQLSSGSLDLTGLFAMNEQERTAGGPRHVGHMHLRAALLALPHIGEKKADEILTEVSIPADRHIDDIGTQEQQKLSEAVAAQQ